MKYLDFEGLKHFWKKVDNVKQNKLDDKQLSAVNSGIDVERVRLYDEYEERIEETRREIVDTAIKESVVGEYISVDDAAEELLPSYKIKGKTTQGSIPTPLTPIYFTPIKIVEVTLLGDSHHDTFRLSKHVYMNNLNVDIYDMLEKHGELWGVDRKIGFYTMTGDEDVIGLRSNDLYARCHFPLAGAIGDGAIGTNCISSHFQATNFNTVDDLNKNCIATWMDNKEAPSGRIDICIEKSIIGATGITDETVLEIKIKQWLKAQAEAGTPIRLIYLQREVFDVLPEADQALFNSLHSYHGNFTIMTQGEQYVTYIADTKLYIDKLIGA